MNMYNRKKDKLSKIILKYFLFYAKKCFWRIDKYEFIKQIKQLSYWKNEQFITPIT